MTSMRTSRAYVGHQTTIAAMTALRRLGPRAAETVIARTSAGKAKNGSVARMRISSTTPPRQPATPPTAMPMTSAVTITVAAAANDSRPPKRTRLRMSRPAWSVPKRKREEGGRSASARRTVSGSYGASSGAATMIVTIAATAALHPTSAGYLRPRWSSAESQTRATAGVIGSTTSARPEKRVDVERKDVNKEIREHEEDRHDDGHTHDRGEVEAADGADRILADAWPGEHDLDHQRTAEQVAELRTHRRDHREEGIPEHVAVEDDRLPEALRPRRPYEVRPDHIEHARPSELHADTDTRDHEHRHRHHELQERALEGEELAVEKGVGQIEG